MAWTSGRLPKERIRALDLHLDGCEHCQSLVAEALRASGNGDELRAREETFVENELLAGRYRVVRFLARGGMGEVYEVYDLWLKDTVALKTLIAQIADDSSALARLKAEVLLARRISHPNVCRVFDLGFHDKRPTLPGTAGERVAFLTMEFLRGETLRARLRRKGRLTLREALPIATQMIAAMAHAHAAGIIHRDFKSDNVMLVTDERAHELRTVVTDFGLARSSVLIHDQPLTASSQRALGTLDYMAPEQLEGKPATQQSDVYALGVVLFEMLTGRLPFEGDSLVARALQRVRSEPPRPGALVRDLEGKWDDVILKCLARDPADRFEQVSDIGALLDMPEAQPPRSRRKSWLLAPLVAALALLLMSLMKPFETADTAAPLRPAGRPVPAPNRERASSTAVALVHDEPASRPSAPTPATASASTSVPPRKVKHEATPVRNRPLVSQQQQQPTSEPAAKTRTPAADRLLDPFQ